MKIASAKINIWGLFYFLLSASLQQELDRLRHTFSGITALLIDCGEVQLENFKSLIFGSSK